jgi:DNA-binding transcriptional ArsR family regulator
VRKTSELATLASLLADPARARIVMALMGGIALTATELAVEAEIAPSTASSHLAKLSGAGLVTLQRQGRHRYYSLADDDIAALVEGMQGVAARRRARRRVPADPALRLARVCYDHLAGERGVWLYDQLRQRGVLAGRDAVVVTSDGAAFLRRFGVDIDLLSQSRRPLCRTCLDWTERRTHLAGAVGTAILDRLFALRWARRELDSRAVVFTPGGDRAFRAQFEAIS